MKDFPMRHALSIAAPNPSFTLAPGGDIVTIESIASQEATQDRELRNPTGNHDSAGRNSIHHLVLVFAQRRAEISIGSTASSVVMNAVVSAMAGSVIVRD